MMLTKRYLWETPVWEIETGFDREFNSGLLTELTQANGGPDFDVWANDGPHLKELRDLIGRQAAQFIEPYYVGMSANVRLQRGWVNMQQQGETHSIHDHGGIAVSAVYYVQTDGAGDLMLVDPRGSTGFGNVIEGPHRNRKHFRVKPVEGKLVLFPGYVLHYVEPNTSPLPRISIATNFWITYGGK